MDYTTDTSEAVEQFLTQKHFEEVNKILNQDLSKSELEFCADLRVLSGAEEDPNITESIKVSEELKAEFETSLDNITKKMDSTPDPDFIKTNRINWLNEFIARIEKEHAAHGVLIELNAGSNEEQVTSSSIAQLSIEGAHKAALEELESLK